VPVYVYRRLDGSTFETRQRMAEDPLVDCPTTGQSVARVLQPFTPRYHGTGSYSTDQRESVRAPADRPTGKMLTHARPTVGAWSCAA
jgi:putative FmdB family regulatory protein